MQPSLACEMVHMHLVPVFGCCCTQFGERGASGGGDKRELDIHLHIPYSIEILSWGSDSSSGLSLVAASRTSFCVQVNGPSRYLRGQDLSWTISRVIIGRWIRKGWSMVPVKSAFVRSEHSRRRYSPTLTWPLMMLTVCGSLRTIYMQCNGNSFGTF